MDRRQRRLIIISSSLSAFIFVAVTLSSYQAEYIGTGNAEVATFYVEGIYTEQFQISLEKLSSSKPNELSFSVVNYQEGIESEVVQEYQILIKSTGNLPLNFSLIGSEAIDDIEDGVLVYDETSGYYESKIGVLQLGEVKHSYLLQVEVASNDDKYSTEIDAIEIIIKSKQKENSL